MMIVMIMPPGSFPGIRNFAMTSTIRPMMMGDDAHNELIRRSLGTLG